MNIMLLSGAGFIGTNLTFALAEDEKNKITVVDTSMEYCEHIREKKHKGVICVESQLTTDTNFEELLSGQEVIYHLISTTVPTTSNQHVSQELVGNVVLTSNLLDACVKCGVKKVIFLSSGGTVYGKEVCCPLKEETPTNPITSYGIQKISIEKLLYLYHYMYGLDYRIVRLSNPYGPYQRPDGILGAVTTFVYKALKKEPITVYGNGSVIRDFIYIEDAVRGILKIANGDSNYKTFNLGCGHGTSISEVLETIRHTLDVELNVVYTSARKVDIPVNYLDIGRYEKVYGKLNPICLDEGIKKTAEFMCSRKMI